MQKLLYKSAVRRWEESGFTLLLELLFYCTKRFCKTYLLHLQDLFVAFAKIYSVRYLLNLRAVLKERDRSHVLPMDDNEVCDAQRDTSL